jgi:Domain of unknown function (DUF4397)
MLITNKRVAAAAAFALIAFTAGCDKRNTDDVADGTVASDSSREGSSMVRVVNANPTDAALDVTADDTPAFAGVAFKTVTPYQSVKDNLVEFEVRPAGASLADSVKPLAQNREMLSDGDRYTLIILPPAPDDSLENVNLRVLEEPTDAGDAGKARIRVVNAARGIATFDLFVPSSTEPFFDDVDFGTEAGFKDLDAGSTRLVIRGDDNGPVLLTLPEQAYGMGRTYTIVVTNKSPNSRELEAVLIEDEVAAPAPATGTDSAPAY